MSYTIYKEGKYIFMKNESETSRGRDFFVRFNLTSKTLYDMLNKKRLPFNRENISEYFFIENVYYFNIEDPIILDLKIIFNILYESNMVYTNHDDTEYGVEKSSCVYYMLKNFEDFEYVQTFNRLIMKTSLIDTSSLGYIIDRNSYPSSLMWLMVYLKNPESIKTRNNGSPIITKNNMFGISGYNKDEILCSELLKKIHKLSQKDIIYVLTSFLNIHDYQTKITLEYCNYLIILFDIFMKDKNLFDLMFISNRDFFKNGRHLYDCYQILLVEVESCLGSKIRELKKSMTKNKIPTIDFIKSMLYYFNVEGLDMDSAIHNLLNLHKVMREDELSKPKTFFPRYLLSKLMQFRTKEVDKIVSIDMDGCLNQDKIYEEEIDGYSFIIPQFASDIVKEGVSQQNCIMSYLGKVQRNECVIFFMRKTESKETSYITGEIIPRDGIINQALKKNNNGVYNDTELEVLKKYAKKKNLIYRG